MSVRGDICTQETKSTHAGDPERFEITDSGCPLGGSQELVTVFDRRGMGAHHGVHRTA